MEKVQWHLQHCLPAKKSPGKPLVWAGSSHDGKAGSGEQEPPVAPCMPAHAGLLATQGKGLLQSCLVLTGLQGGRRKGALPKACLGLCLWHCCGPWKGMLGAVLYLSRSPKPAEPRMRTESLRFQLSKAFCFRNVAEMGPLQQRKDCPSERESNTTAGCSCGNGLACMCTDWPHLPH